MMIRTASSLLLIAGLAACAAPEQERSISSQPSFGYDVPMESPVAYIDEVEGSSPRLNAHGGEIPKGLRTESVDQGSLGEISPS